jgi:hypothetical protein
MSSFQATINDDKEMWKIKDIVVQEKKLLFEETGNQQETDNIEQDKPEEEMFASLLTEVTNNDYKRPHFFVVIYRCLKTRHKIYIARQLTKIWFFRLRE